MLISCHSSSEEKINLLEYTWNNSDGRYREYRYSADTMVTQIFINQRTIQINDSTWELNSVAVRSDSLPIFKGKERYTQSSIELLENSGFELDPKTNTLLEVKGKLVKNAICLLNQSPCFSEIEYTSQVIPVITNVHVELKFELQDIDSLGFSPSPYLVATSFEKFNNRDLATQKDTILEVKNVRIFAKGKGLVLFTRNLGNKIAIYKLVE